MTNVDLIYLLDIADRIERVSKERITGEFDICDADRIREIAGSKGRLALLLAAIERRLECCRAEGHRYVSMHNGTWNGEIKCANCLEDPPLWWVDEKK
jgi:hypothetical protein